MTHAGLATFTQGLTVLYGSSLAAAAAPAVLQFQRRLGTAAVATGTSLGVIQFTGWDSAADAVGAQIRSVHTVSTDCDGVALAALLVDWENALYCFGECCVAAFQVHWIVLMCFRDYIAKELDMPSSLLNACAQFISASTSAAGIYDVSSDLH